MYYRLNDHSYAINQQVRIQGKEVTHIKKLFKMLLRLKGICHSSGFVPDYTNIVLEYVHVDFEETSLLLS